MTTILYVLFAILIFGVLVAVHEGGHFTAAKLCGVKVEEFSIGLGPAIWKKQRGETLYSLRCIPFGGYCSMSGEDEASDDPRAFTSQPAYKRIIILIAGSVMNFLLGLLVVILLYADADAFYAPVLAGFFDNCPYQGEEALMEGDRILRIDGKRVWQYYEVSDYLAEGDGTYDIVVRRDGKRVRINDLKMIPLEYEGYTNKMYGFQFGIDDGNFANVVRHSWGMTMDFGRWVWMGLQDLFKGNAGIDDMSGVVGIVDLMAETGEQAESTADAVYDILYIAAFIAVNLAIMNMLPIPALDGGRVFLLIVTVIIEKITRKKLDPKYEGYIHAAGMILLLALMAYLVFHDIYRIVIK